MNVAIIRKVREPYGILGNMSAHKIFHDGRLWHTSEALFQALRFDPSNPIRELIRAEKNPMKAKWTAKAKVDEMILRPCSQTDLGNMRIVLELKYTQHQEVKDVLESTKGMRIVEDCTNRQRGSGLFWGAALKEGEWVGENWLGELWMELR